MKEKKIQLSIINILIISILYVALPIIVFFIGWLKIYISIPLCILLIYSIFLFIKSSKVQLSEKFLILDKKIVIFTLLLLLLWVYFSGIGGFWVQRWDQNARNAVLRDLIDYSWPVIFPETGNALVYYFIFWMIPALVGKLFGWCAANIALLIWSYLGIILMMLLLCYFLKLNSLKKVITFVTILIFWGGLCFLTWALMDAIGWHYFGLGSGYGWTDLITDYKNPSYGYQFTPNTGLIKWVFNQTIVPWIITCIYLIRRGNIKEYAFIGLLMLPYGPIPFIGLFLLMIADAIIYLKNNNIVLLVKESLSLCNILGIISIVPIFYLFFKCNVAANGGVENGGFGLYVPLCDFTLKRILVLILFYIEEFGLFAILIYNDFKKNNLFWAVIVSLILIPNFKIGIAHDFCMRACIPALFILMTMVIEHFNKIYDGILTIKLNTILLIIVLAFASLNTIGDYLIDIKTIRTTKQFPYKEDNVITFSHRPVYNDPEIFYTINFLTPNPEDTIFFKYLSR